MKCDKCDKEIKDFNGFFALRYNNCMDAEFRTSIAFVLCDICTNKTMDYIENGED